MKFKVVNEYKRFYLCRSPNGYLECFNKLDYRPNDDGMIIVKDEFL